MSVSRTEARRAVATRLGGHGTLTATGGTNTTIVCAAAFKSGTSPATSVLPGDYLDGAYILAPGSLEPRQKRVAPNGLQTSSGTITLEDAFGSSFAGGGIAFEIHTILAGADGTAPGLSVDGSVDQALKYLILPSVVSLQLQSGQYDYELPSWLDRASRLTDVRQPNARGTTTITSPNGWELRASGGTNSLHVARPYRFEHGEFSVSLQTMRPADTWVNGADASDSPGLQAETDTVDVPIASIVEVALLFCYASLAQSEDASTAAHYARLVAGQIAAARAVYGYDKEADVAASMEASVPARAGAAA